MPKNATVRISATELPHFGRLVTFVMEVEDHARDTEDEELAKLVETLRADLTALGGAER